LLLPVASAGAIVAVTYDTGPFRVVTADRADLGERAVLPVRDRQAFYSNGGLSPLAMGDDGTVLLRVAMLGGGAGDWRARRVGLGVRGGEPGLPHRRASHHLDDLRRGPVALTVRSCTTSTCET
jgi:hypothetical protein